MRVVLYAIRVKGGCVLWIRYPENYNDITRRKRKAIIFSSERNLPDSGLDNAEFNEFIRETIAKIRTAGLNLLNAKDFESGEETAEPELETV